MDTTLGTTGKKMAQEAKIDSEAKFHIQITPENVAEALFKANRNKGGVEWEFLNSGRHDEKGKLRHGDD